MRMVRQLLCLQNLEIRSVTLEQATVTVDFSEEYLQMNDLRRLFCRSSVVWTLTSLDFVKNVRILVEGEPLKNQNGEAYAIFNRDNVWIDTEISAETTGYAILTLYFANAEGTDLVAEERVVEVNANQTREKIRFGTADCRTRRKKAVLQRFLSVQKSRM